MRSLVVNLQLANLQMQKGYDVGGQLDLNECHFQTAGWAHQSSELLFDEFVIVILSIDTYIGIRIESYMSCICVVVDYYF